MSVDKKHEYKNWIDLSQFENMECDCHYSHRKGLSVVAKCNMCGKEHDFDDEGLLAYARELEARVARMQEAGDRLAEVLDATGYLDLRDASVKGAAITAWRNA